MLYLSIVSSSTLFFPPFCFLSGEAFFKDDTPVKQEKIRGEWCNKAIQSDFFL